MKNLREAQVQLNDGFARFRSGELWLEGLRLRPTALQLDSVPTNKTASKAALHRAELKRLSDQVDRERCRLFRLRCTSRTAG